MKLDPNFPPSKQQNRLTQFNLHDTLYESQRITRFRFRDNRTFSRHHAFVCLRVETFF